MGCKLLMIQIGRRENVITGESLHLSVRFRVDELTRTTLNSDHEVLLAHAANEKETGGQIRGQRTGPIASASAQDADQTSQLAIRRQSVAENSKRLAGAEGRQKLTLTE